MRISFMLLVLLFVLQSPAQGNTEELVTQLVKKIGQLRSDELVQKAIFSKADYCAMSVTFTYLDEDPPGEEIMFLKLSDMDENEIDIEYNEALSEWDLSVYCVDFEEHVLVMDKEAGNTYEGILMLSDNDVNVLQELKILFKKAIIGCKAN